MSKRIPLEGKKIGRLTVTEYLGKLKYRCVCDCGNIVTVRRDCLLSGTTKSCGCLSKERDFPQKWKDDFVDGTQLSKIQSKPTKSNKSGVVGVNWDKSRNQWQASLKFRGHKYNLGRFDSFDDAVDARKAAEKEIFGDLRDNK